MTNMHFDGYRGSGVTEVGRKEGSGQTRQGRGGRAGESGRERSAFEVAQVDIHRICERTFAPIRHLLWA